MLNLVAKDLLANRWFLLIALPLYAIQVFSMGEAPAAELLVALVFSGVFAFAPLGIEEAQGTEPLWNSLPVRRADVVIARYLSTLIGTLLGVGIYAAVIRPPVVFSALLFSWVMLAAALFLPCYFRFGIGKGLAVFSVLGLALMILFSAVGLFVTRPDIVVDAGQVEAAEAWLEAWSHALAAGLALVTLAVLGLSTALSVTFYNRRDL